MNSKKMSQLPKYTYYGYGLNISSEIELPLPLIKHENNFDVNIVFGKIPKNIECERKISSYLISQEHFILNFKGIKMYAGFGKKIIIETSKEDGFNIDDAVPFILSSCIGTLLHQRKMLIFHASAVMTENGAVLFFGTSSSGKSTIATVLNSKCYEVLSDNICPVCIVKGKAVMYPSGEKVQLWKDIINTLKIPAESLKKVRPSIEKYEIDNYCNIHKPINISNIYLLNPSNQILYEINSKYSVKQKLNILKNNIYCRNFVKEMFIENQYYRSLKQLAQTVPVKEFIKPNSEFIVNKLAETLLNDIKN